MCLPWTEPSEQFSQKLRGGDDFRDLSGPLYLLEEDYAIYFLDAASEKSRVSTDEMENGTPSASLNGGGFFGYGLCGVFRGEPVL